jgi:hypothetical protein
MFFEVIVIALLAMAGGIVWTEVSREIRRNKEDKNA